MRGVWEDRMWDKDGKMLLCCVTGVTGNTGEKH